MGQDYKDRYGAMDYLINEMSKLSLADIRSASRNEHDEFERVAAGIVDTIASENERGCAAHKGNPSPLCDSCN